MLRRLLHSYDKLKIFMVQVFGFEKVMKLQDIAVVILKFRNTNELPVKEWLETDALNRIWEKPDQ